MILGVCDNGEILSVLRIVKLVITILQIAVPILLLVSVMISYMDAVKDKGDVSKVNKSLISRSIAAVCIFFVPFFVKLIVNIVSPGEDGYASCLNNATPEGISMAFEVSADEMVKVFKKNINNVNYNNAISAINKIKDEQKKQQLLTEVNNYYQYLKVEQDINKLANNWDKTNYNNLKAYIAGISDPEIRARLEEKLSEISPAFNIDTSNMSANAIAWLEVLSENWPPDMEEQRYKAIETALSLLDKGITYSQPNRHAKNAAGMPISMDCSSFVTYCLVSARENIASSAYTGTYITSGRFTTISKTDLTPGDVALYNATTSGGNSNHIGLYLGKDNQGNYTWIECSGGGVKVSHNNGWTVFKRYNSYDPNYSA